MVWLVLLFAVVGSGSGRVAVDRVDLLELNHAMAEDCSGEMYTQIIAWEWSPDYRRYHVVGWRIVDKQIGPAAYICRDGGDWVAKWQRGCEVRARLFRESITCGDPERDDGKLFDPSLRRKLIFKVEHDGRF